MMTKTHTLYCFDSTHAKQACRHNKFPEGPQRNTNYSFISDAYFAHT